MQVRTPARPSSASDIIEFSIGVDNLVDPSNNQAVVIPTIVMHVNPNNMNFAYRKLINRYRTRGGWVEEHWGDELDIITCQAATGSFFTFAGGLTVSDRNNALSMVNFQEILGLYKGNANVFDNSGNVIAQGDVVINYDHYQLFGQFSNFSWDEDATKPYQFTFNFTYEVKKTVIGL